MFIHQLFEDSPRRVVVTYPGRFQPFHKGHRDVFANLQKRFGIDNVFIVTGNKTDAYKSPFNFSDKIKFITAMGIPADRVIETDKVYELPAAFQPHQDQVVFITVVGAPDAKRLNPGSTKKDGSPSYFQVLPKDAEQMVTADKHGYVIVEPEHPEQITIGGKVYDVSHGTPTRELWNQVRNNPQQRNEFLQQLYGTTDPELGATLDKIPTGAPEPAPQPSPKLAKVKPNAAPKKPQAKLSSVKLPKPEKIAPVKPKKVEKELGEDPQFVGKWKGTDSAKAARGKYVGEDAAGVGVVKNSKDPRYVMATAGLQNDVDSKTLGKMMKGYHLIGKNPANTKQTPVKSNIAESSRDWDEGNKEPANNFAVYINGKKWKVFQGHGYYADDERERAQYYKLKDWARKKSQQTGKQWEVYVTGEPVTEEWSDKYKRSINCNSPKGFSQRAHCAGRKTNESAEELNIGDDVVITGNVQFKGATGVITDFGSMKRFVIVDLYNHGKHSFHSSDVSYNEYADSDQEEADMYDRDEDFRNWSSRQDEGMYQYDKEDPYNSEFAPSVGMGRMTLRGWKQSLIRRAQELAKELELAGQHIDSAAFWDRIHAKLKSLNMDPIAQEIELAHQELENIRRRGGVRSRAFNK